MKAAARLPLQLCVISSDWREELYATVICARQGSGLIAASVFMADLGCLGIKHALGHTDLTEDEFADIFRRFSGEQELIECKPAFALRLLTGACDYAASLGFKPDPDYFAAKEIFGNVAGEDNDPGEIIEYGRDGKPFYVAGPYDNVDMIVNRLTRRFGEDGFDFVIPAFEGDLDDEEDSDDEEEWEE